MIVSRKMAEEALITLNMAGLEGLGPEQVNASYRTAAKAAHPDAGGTSEAFAAVDRARHVLLKWLERSEAPQTPGMGTVCARCQGKGFITSQRAWRALRVQCPTCRGTGDIDSEREKGDYL